MNHSIIMALSYVFGQGLYFITLAYLLYTGQKDVAGWLSVKLAYMSFIFQLSDLGTLNVIARAWNEKREKDLDEFVLIRGLYSFIAGIALALAAYHFGEHDVYFVTILPFVCALAGLSRLFEYELQGNYSRTAIIQSAQWIFILIFCAVERLLFDSGGVILYLPMMAFYLINGKFNIFSVKLFNISKTKHFASIFFIGVAGQFWGRLIIQLIYSEHGSAIVSAYSLVRGVLAGLVKFTTNFIRPQFVKLSTSINMGTYSIASRIIGNLFFLQLLIVVLLWVVFKNDELIVLLLWPAWTLYSWHSLQWMYSASPKSLLFLEIIMLFVAACIFLLMYKNNLLVSILLSDFSRVVVMLVVIEALILKSKKR